MLRNLIVAMPESLSTAQRFFSENIVYFYKIVVRRSFFSWLIRDDTWLIVFKDCALNVSRPVFN